MKAVAAAFNQEKALLGAFSVITNLRMELFEALLATYRDVDVEDVALLQLPGVGHTVGRHVVHRGGDALGEPLEVEEGGVGTLGLVLQTVYRQS